MKQSHANVSMIQLMSCVSMLGQLRCVPSIRLYSNMKPVMPKPVQGVVIVKCVYHDTCADHKTPRQRACTLAVFLGRFTSDPLGSWPVSDCKTAT